MLRKHPVAAFLVLTFVISWSVVAFSAATIVNGRGQQIGVVAMVFVAQFGPALAALIVTGVVHGRPGVRALLRAAVAVRRHLRLLVFALLFYPLLFAAAVGITVLLGAPAPDLAGEPATRLVTTFVPALLLGLVFGGFSEEPGWRGFLLPRLQQRFGFVGAAIVIGALWSVWHLDPEHVAVGWQEGWSAFSSAHAPILLKYLSETVAMSIVMAWLFNRSRGSLALMIVIHASSNAAITTLKLLWETKPAAWSPTVTVVQWVAALVFLGLALRAPLQVADAAEEDRARRRAPAEAR